MSDDLDAELIRSLRDTGVTDLDISGLKMRGYFPRVEAYIFRILYGRGPELTYPDRPTRPYEELTKSDYEVGTYSRLIRGDVTTLGILQMLSPTDLAIHGIRTRGLESIGAALKIKSLRLREEDESLRQRAKSVFVRAERIPVAYLQARGAVESASALRIRGIYRLGTFNSFPKSRLATVSNPKFQVDKIEAELQALGLTFGP